MKREVWKTIKEFPDYEVSNIGRVRSKARVVHRSDGRPLPLKAQLMKLRSHSKGYLRVWFRKGEKAYARLVHRLVAYYFIGPPPKGKPFVLHKDDNKDNNELPNLYYGSPAMNTRDAFLNGRMNTILIDEEVVEIKSREGEDIGKLAEEYNVTRGAIHNIFSGRSWSWIKPENKEVQVS